MSSGAKVADRVKDLYNEMKLAKNDPGRLRFVTLGFCDNCIDVTASTQDKDLVGKDPFVFFMDLLAPDECRYILYDCHYETVDSVKKEIVSVMWCPDTLLPKQKMNYASSRDALKKSLEGIKHHLQLNDPSDCSDRNTFAAQLGKDLISLEGVPVNVAEMNKISRR